MTDEETRPIRRVRPKQSKDEIEVAARDAALKEAFDSVVGRLEPRLASLEASVLVLVDALQSVGMAELQVMQGTSAVQQVADLGAALRGAAMAAVRVQEVSTEIMQERITRSVFGNESITRDFLPETDEPLLLDTINTSIATSGRWPADRPAPRQHRPIPGIESDSVMGADEFDVDIDMDTED